METEEYIGEVLPDGRLSLPEKVVKELRLEPYARVKVTIGKVEQDKRNYLLSNEAKRKAFAIKEFIADMGPENLSEKFRERYK